MSSLLELPALFGPNSAIPAILLNHLVAMAAAAMPGYATATPESQAGFRLYVQHAIAAYEPHDAQEVMLASSLVTLRSQASEAFRIAGHPEVTPQLARANRSLGASMHRSLQQGERLLRTARAQREKTKPAWRAEKPETASANPRQFDPMPSEKPAARTPAAPPLGLAATLKSGTAVAALGAAGDMPLRAAPPGRDTAPAGNAATAARARTVAG